jgi:hypothetical protein
MAGVVGHPVSEKGKRGGSPSLSVHGNALDRTRLLPRKRDFAGERGKSPQVVSDGFNRYLA